MSACSREYLLIPSGNVSISGSDSDTYYLTLASNETSSNGTGTVSRYFDETNLYNTYFDVIGDDEP